MKREEVISSNEKDTEVGHVARSHALCSASSAERWLNCPGAIALSRTVPRKETSSYALEGTKAHELSEKYLHAWLKKEEVQIEHDDLEMKGHVESYVEYVKNKSKEFSSPPQIRIESRLMLNKDLDMHGVADIAMTGGKDLGWHGKIIDLKYGKVKVIAKENAQLAYYAAALMMTSKNILDSIEVSIVQPRIDSITTVTYDREELMIWHGVLCRGAEKALMQIVMPTKREYVRGKWCKYCDAKTVCPEMNKPFDGVVDEFNDSSS